MISSEIKNKTMTILQSELPSEVGDLIRSNSYNNQEIEQDELKFIYNKAKNDILVMLVGEFGFPERNVEGFVEEIINENYNSVKNIIGNAREGELEKNIGLSNGIIKNNAEMLELENKIGEEFNNFYSKTNTEIEEILNDNNRTIYQIYDSINNEMYSECKRWINRLPLNDDFEMVGRFKNILQRLSQDIQDEYLSTSKNITNQCQQGIENKIKEAVYSCLDDINNQIDVKDSDYKFKDISELIDKIKTGIEIGLEKTADRNYQDESIKVQKQNELTILSEELQKIENLINGNNKDSLTTTEIVSIKKTMNSVDSKLDSLNSEFILFEFEEQEIILQMQNDINNLENIIQVKENNTNELSIQNSDEKESIIDDIWAKKEYIEELEVEFNRKKEHLTNGNKEETSKNLLDDLLI